MSKKTRAHLRSGARKKVSFDLTPRAHDLLRADAARRNITQITLLELIIRDYCDPERKSYDPEGRF